MRKQSMLGTMHFKIKTWRGLYKCRSQNERSWRFSYKMSLSTLEVTFVQAGFQFLSPLARRKGGRLSERFEHPSNIYMFQCFDSGASWRWVDYRQLLFCVFMHESRQYFGPPKCKKRKFKSSKMNRNKANILPSRRKRWAKKCSL